MPKMNTETLKFFESLTQAHALQVAELQKVIDTQSESIRDMQETISRLEETVRILTHLSVLPYRIPPYRFLLFSWLLPVQLPHGYPLW